MKVFNNEQFREFSLNFSKNAHTIELGNYISKNMAFQIHYLEKLSDNTFCRINVDNYCIELSKHKIKLLSNETIYYLLNNVYLLLYLSDSYNYCGEKKYLTADFISLLKCNEEKMCIKTIIKEVADMLITVNTPLNKKRISQIINILNLGVK